MFKVQIQDDIASGEVVVTTRVSQAQLLEVYSGRFIEEKLCHVIVDRLATHFLEKHMDDMLLALDPTEVMDDVLSKVATEIISALGTAMQERKEKKP